ncbi:hypothetical protein F511_41901 [Dorcoceras hygrometricum]|uniref:Uncharacterized protein n=1 Tax=Dorcoceras hygrometricum TaxID=472368 RepID=A0A2Z7CLH2_9LAMI|nr:hypothetical protein F511_41901 [Dorcoceras hygrometricum]
MLLGEGRNGMKKTVVESLCDPNFEEITGALLCTWSFMVSSSCDLTDNGIAFFECS